MKLTWMFFVLTFSSQLALAQPNQHFDLSTIQSVDDQELPPSSSEPSAQALPHEELLQYLEDLHRDRFTIVAEARVRQLFTKLAKNPRARMRVAGGKCSYRRHYIQDYLKKQSIISGKLYIQCPSNKGRLRLNDQVTGRRYTFSNFHDTNIVAVPNGYRVMDVQFKPGPVTLASYLAGIEASQKLKPLRNRASGDRGYCYWSIK